ncbi:MAG: YegP family protein [Phycisphaerales bacterium]|nr:YegP family protein [Phycisphaerales bacterium]
MSAFELKAAKDGQFYFNLVGAPPLALLLSSDKFATKEAAHHAIERVKTNAAIDERYEKKASNINRLFFVLTGDDQQVLATSGRFDSEADRDAAMHEIKSNAPGAAIKDMAGA